MISSNHQKEVSQDKVIDLCVYSTMFGYYDQMIIPTYLAGRPIEGNTVNLQQAIPKREYKG